MTFNEANTIEDYVCDLLCGELPESIAGLSGEGVEESPSTYGVSGLGWDYIPHTELPRQQQEVMVEDQVRKP